MWGDPVWGEGVYAEPSDSALSPFQDRTVFAVLELVAAGAGASNVPIAGQASFGFEATAIAGRSLTRVKTVNTHPHSKTSKTGLSHTGLN